MTEEEFNDSLIALRREIEEWWQARQPSPPATVYHYTSVDGLRGIISSSRLWATLASEVNDTTELHHASETLKRVLRRHAAAATLPEYQILFPPQVLDFQYPRPDLASTFIASLSGSEDDLPQWCMYAENFCGVAIGLDSARLRELDLAENAAQPIGFFAVSYSEQEQDAFFDWLVSRWAREAVPAVARDLRYANNPLLYMAHWFGNLAVGALSVLARMKSRYFHSENEWRLAHLHTRGRADCPVISQDGARTHVELDLGQLVRRLPITSVWLAPRVANDHSERALRSFLDTHKFQEVTIHRSAVPLRGTPHTLMLS